MHLITQAYIIMPSLPFVDPNTMEAITALLADVIMVCVQYRGSSVSSVCYYVKLKGPMGVYVKHGWVLLTSPCNVYVPYHMMIVHNLNLPVAAA